MYAFCPDCDSRIDFPTNAQEGQLITCHNCESELEIIGLNPPELDWAYVGDDDWDWDDEWDYDDWEDEELEAM